MHFEALLTQNFNSLQKQQKVAFALISRLNFVKIFVYFATLAYFESLNTLLGLKIDILGLFGAFFTLIDFLCY